MSTNFEMMIESCATLSCVDDVNFEIRSISELVSFLGTAFRAKDFDKVEAVLVAKEVKMRKEIESKNKEYELLQSKYEFLRLDNLTHKSMQDKVEVDPKEFGKLKEMENEIQQLKELIIKVNEDREKKKSALDEFEKKLEVVEEAQEYDKLTIQNLNHKNSELQSAIEAAKKEKEEYEKTKEELKHKNLKMYELHRRKYEELAHRVWQLENARTVVENGEPIASNRNDQLKDKRVDKIENGTGTGGCFVEIISDDDHATGEHLFRAHRNQKRRRGSLLNNCEDYDAEK